MLNLPLPLPLPEQTGLAARQAVIKPVITNDMLAISHQSIVQPCPKRREKPIPTPTPTQSHREEPEWWAGLGGTCLRGGSNGHPPGLCPRYKGACRALGTGVSNRAGEGKKHPEGERERVLRGTPLQPGRALHTAQVGPGEGVLRDGGSLPGPLNQHQILRCPWRKSGLKAPGPLTGL